MGHKIFVSYKYSDDDVEELPNAGYCTTARSYVDVIEERLGVNDVYKGEKDGEDLSLLSAETIKAKLADRLYDSTVTIVLVSPGMRDVGLKESDQWIPWEISYSLKTECRHTDDGCSVHSYPNGMVAVVLPDKGGRYDYCLGRNTCCPTSCRVINKQWMFPVLAENIFNKKDAQKTSCSNELTIWHGECGYIEVITWDAFLEGTQLAIDRAFDRKERIKEFDIHFRLDG